MRPITSILRTTTNSAASMLGARHMKRFNYPHSYMGTSSAMTNLPQKRIYPDIPRDMKPGDKAPYAH